MKPLPVEEIRKLERRIEDLLYGQISHVAEKYGDNAVQRLSVGIPRSEASEIEVKAAYSLKRNGYASTGQTLKLTEEGTKAYKAFRQHKA